MCLVVPVNTKRARVDGLPDDVEKLKELLAERDATMAAQRFEIEYLRKVAFGKKSEKRPRSADLAELSAQGYLFHAELLAEAERTAQAEGVQGELTLEPAKRKGRRTRFPDHVPHVTTRYELEAEACKCE